MLPVEPPKLMLLIFSTIFSFVMRFVNVTPSSETSIPVPDVISASNCSTATVVVNVNQAKVVAPRVMRANTAANNEMNNLRVRFFILNSLSYFLLIVNLNFN